MANQGIEETLRICLPLALVRRIEEFQRLKQTGQILINCHYGEVQSNENKEHYRSQEVTRIEF